MIYAIVIPALTILFGLIQCVSSTSAPPIPSYPRYRLFWAQPRTEVVFLFIVGVLWLSTYSQGFFAA